mgnify:CR=1 FL=1
MDFEDDYLTKKIVARLINKGYSIEEVLDRWSFIQEVVRGVNDVFEEVFRS